MQPSGENPVARADANDKFAVVSAVSRAFIVFALIARLGYTGEHMHLLVFMPI